ncbi:proline--tRNA ligase [Candidatus Woesebacteria bacterium]|nr:proline--tRNA ligase [Candidatus Woesebacteria bacterium]
MKQEKELLPRKSEDLSKWYLSLIDLAKLADYGPAKGTMVIRPYAYAIWEQVQKVLDKWFKSDGVQNAYFPMLIPSSLLEREKSHVEGFSPELAVVTIGGGKQLEEPLVVRPTSEAIMYEMFSKWIASYKDLPLKINQWVNVVRWELRTFPFLRTSEFLWQEGHTVHTTEKEAMEMTLKALEWYQKFYEDYFAISSYIGEKSGSERFAGAKRTFSVELVMPDGKALQGATSHYLGQNFSQAFNIQYSDDHNKRQFAHQTSWGLSTRSLGGLIMVHGDDHGLILPPRVAPYQVVLITVNAKDDETDAKIRAYTRTIEDLLKKARIRYIVDDNNEKGLGYRINEAEIQGIPVRLIIGKSEYEEKFVTFSRRDKTAAKEKVRINGLGEFITTHMEEMQLDLLAASRKKKEEMTVDVETFEEFEKVMSENKKFIRAYWDESQVVEAKIKEKTKATTRVIEIDRMLDEEDGTCVYSGNKARRKWLFAQSY